MSVVGEEEEKEKEKGENVGGMGLERKGSLGNYVGKVGKYRINHSNIDIFQNHQWPNLTKLKLTHNPTPNRCTIITITTRKQQTNN